MPTRRERYWRSSGADRRILGGVSTDVAIFAGRKITLPAGWTKQRLVAIFGGAQVDASAPPGAGAVLRMLTILGGAEVRVPNGARVTVGGLALLGGRRVEVRSDPEGPEIRLVAFTVLGGLRVRDEQ
jgi:hypothetical protein